MVKTPNSDRSCTWLLENNEIDRQFKAWNPTVVKCSKCAAGSPNECNRKNEIDKMVVICVRSRSKPTQRTARVRKTIKRHSYGENHTFAKGERYQNKKQTQKPTKKSTPLVQFLNMTDNKNAPSAVRQGRVHFAANTPTKLKGRRLNDLTNVLSHGIGQLANIAIPNCSSPRKIQLLTEAVSKYSTCAKEKSKSNDHVSNNQKNEYV